MAETPREEYTWETAVTDLALSTCLTVGDAFDLTYPMRGQVDPYDVVAVLAEMLRNIDWPRERSYGILGHILMKMLSIPKIMEE